jgi:chromate reductase, NAD(P)H dehydrogenase (quinone)
MENKKIRIVGIAGSLRKNSYNAAALRATREFLPENVTMETVEIGDLPFFNEDVESAGLPASVVAFKAKLAAADALLIATPEYNYGIPPILKNAIDWASRGESAVYGKPVGILSASPSMLGGARAQ